MLPRRADSYSFSSATMIKVSTMPMAGLPALRRALTSAEPIFADVVFSSSMIMTVLAARAESTRVGVRCAHTYCSYTPADHEVETTVTAAWMAALTGQRAALDQRLTA